MYPRRLGHIFRNTLGSFASDTNNRRIFRGASVLGILSLAAALATAVRDLVIAASFGTSDAIDAYFVALLLPNFIIVVITGSFSAAFIPTYLRVRTHEGFNAAQTAFSQVFFLGVLVLVVISVLATVIGPLLLPFIASGFDPEKLRLTMNLYYWCVPLIVIGGLGAIYSAVLNANERFVPAAFAPIIVPIASIVALLTAGRAWGIYALAVGSVAGFALQLFTVGLALRKQGLATIPRWRGLDPNTRSMIDQYLPMVVGIAALGGTLFVDQAMAASLGSGSVAALAYGNKLAALVVILGITVAKTMVFPHFSKWVAEQNWDQISNTLRIGTRLILIVTIPLTFLLFLFSTPIAELLFERGAFGAQDSHLVGRVQAMYVLQIPFQILGNFFNAFLSSLGANHILMRGWLASLFLNIILNYVFMSFLGVSGIALASSVVYAILCAGWVGESYRKIRGLRIDAAEPT